MRLLDPADKNILQRICTRLIEVAQNSLQLFLNVKGYRQLRDHQMPNVASDKLQVISCKVGFKDR